MLPPPDYYAQLCALVADRFSAEELEEFSTAPQPGLGGRTPLAALAAGDVEKVGRHIERLTTPMDQRPPLVADVGPRLEAPPSELTESVRTFAGHMETDPADLLVWLAAWWDAPSAALGGRVPSCQWAAEPGAVWAAMQMTLLVRY